MNADGPVEFLLLGDSHAGAIGRAARDAGTGFVGGPLGSGRDFTRDFFDPLPGDVRFRSERSEGYYRKFLTTLGADRLSAVPCPLICTFGLSLHFYAIRENWDIYRPEDGPLTADFLTSPLFDRIIAAMAADALRFYHHAVTLAGPQVFAVLPPQRVPDFSDPLVFFAAQTVMADRLTGLGVSLLDVRAESSGPDGHALPAYCEEADPLHANRAFGHLVLNAFRQAVGTDPRMVTRSP